MTYSTQPAMIKSRRRKSAWAAVARKMPWSSDSGRRISFGLGAALVSLTAGALVLRGGASSHVLLGLFAIGVAGFVFATNLFAAFMAWVAVEGLAFPFVRYPLHHNLVTFDRIVVLGFGVALLLSAWGPMGRQSRRLAIAFTLFAVVFGLRAFFTHPLPPAPYHLPVAPLQQEATWVDDVLLPLIVFLVAARTVTPERWKRLVKALVFLGVSVATLGLLEWRVGFHLAPLSGFSVFSDTSDAQLGLIRSSGPYSDPSAYGGVLVICIAATLYWLQAERAYLVGGAALTIELLGLAPSYTKTIWGAGFVAVLIGLGIRRRLSSRTALVAFYATTALGIIYTLVQNAPTVAERVTGSNANFISRLGAYAEGVRIFMKWPWFGVGVENFASAQQLIAPVTIAGVAAANTAHNTFVGMLAETGVTGFMALMFLAYAMIAVVRESRRRVSSEEEILFSAMVLAASTGYLLLSLTFGESYYPPTTAFLALILGAAAARLDRGRGEQDSSPRGAG